MALERREALEPSWAWLMFGDGYEAQIVSMMPGVNAIGDEVWKLVLRPTKELASRHNITNDMLDDDLLIRVEYPIEMIIQLSHDPALPRYLCFLNFNAEPCPATDYLLGKIESDKIINLKKITELQKSQIAYLTEKLEKLSTNIREYIKEYVQGPAEEMSSHLLNQLSSQQFTSPMRQS